MKKAFIKVPAKINLTLDVVGVSGSYHDISSLVASINLFDAITISERKDNRITLKNKGLAVGCASLDNNAYKSAKLYKKHYNVKGVDIVIEKNIPVGGGLGGSSADIAGVLLGMETLFGCGADLKKLASELGSDSKYMLTGGYAIMTGRGDEVSKVNTGKILPLLLITDDSVVSARSVYKKYDEDNLSYPPCTDKVLQLIKEDNWNKVYSLLKNDLSPACSKFCENLSFSLKALEFAGAKASILSGSGPTAVGIFSSTRERNVAFNKLKPLFGNNLIKAETIPNPKLILN